MPNLQQIKLSDKIQTPLISELKLNTFQFVDIEPLCENLSIALQYVVHFSQFLTVYELPGAIQYTLIKSIISHIASITEALLIYAIQKGLNLGKFTESQVQIKEEKYKDMKSLYRIDVSKHIVGGTRETTYKTPNGDTHFDAIVTIAKRVGVFQEDLKIRIDNLRKKRNKIHLVALSEVEDYYQMSDITEANETLSKVIDAVKNFVS